MQHYYRCNHNDVGRAEFFPDDRDVLSKVARFLPTHVGGQWTAFFVLSGLCSFTSPTGRML